MGSSCLRFRTHGWSGFQPASHDDRAIESFQHYFAGTPVMAAFFAAAGCVSSG